MNYPTRRTALGFSAAGLTGLLTGCSGSSSNDSSSPANAQTPASASPTSTKVASYVMPEEGATHTRTWMSLCVNDDIWGNELADPARGALVRIASAIAKFEPVSALIDPDLDEPKVPEGVTLLKHRADDLWMRDTGPTFVTSSGEVSGVDFNFNGWGKKQKHDLDAKVAQFVCEQADVPRVSTKLVLEGGALEVDGEGTAIITESCVLNANRNPGWSKERVEKELERTLGVTKVIWLPGIAGKDITDGHTDFYARFAKPGVVVAGREDDEEQYDYAVTRKHLDILKMATDAKGRKLDIHVIPGPSSPRTQYMNDSFAAGYINFYVCNGGVIAPQFGDEDADAFAKKTLEELFSDREIVQINIDPIAAGGGGIHCTTQQQPKGQ